ncbi:MAG: T9SS type A sorting domain-containing protein [Flavobacteriales bacterium]
MKTNLQKSIRKASRVTSVITLALMINAPDAFAQGRGHGNGNGNGNNGGSNSNNTCIANVSASFASDGKTVTAMSDKNLSNVVLRYCDGTHQKFEPLSGHSAVFSGTGSNSGKSIDGVWIKSGCYQSGDGPGYGAFVANPDANVCNPLPPGCFAHEVVSYNPGLRFNDTPVAESRRNPEKALGEPQRSDATTSEANVNFVALGFGGELTIKFIAPIKNGPGADIKVWETTFAPSTGNCVAYPERIQAFASQDGCNWRYIGDGCQDAEFDFSEGGLEWAQYIRLIDISPKAAFANVGHIADGYDVDGVECLNGYEANPVFQQFDCQFATFVVDYNAGPRRNGPAPLIERQDATKALGAPERIDSQNFVSLGFGGSLILGFSCVIFDKPGYDIEIVETSFGNQNCNSYPERAVVEGSLDLVNWFTIGEICLDGFLDLDGKGPIQYLRITDISNPLSFSNSNTSDGYDVDGVIVLQPGCNGAARMMSTPTISNIIEIAAFPNPFNESLNLNFVNGVQDENISIAIYNQLGQKVFAQTLNVAKETAFQHAIDMSAQAKGFYVINVMTGNHVQTLKVIKQ